MAGLQTNGVPTVGPAIQNTTTVTPPLGQYSQLSPTAALIAADTEGVAGVSPQTVAVSAFQIAAHAAALSKNTATSTAGAATLNTIEGLVTTEALTTAAGATYTFTLTNSLILSGTQTVPQMALLDGTNTAGNVQINSIVNGTGSVVAVFQNVGTAAWNGTKLLAFHV